MKERQDILCVCRSTGVQEQGVDGDRSSWSIREHTAQKQGVALVKRLERFLQDNRELLKD